MQFYEVIENRKSIKKFKNTSIEKDKLNKIINAAMMAPSWKNKTSYKFILVDDVNIKEQLANSIMNNSDEASNAIKEAPMTVLVVSDPKQSGQVNNKEYYLVDSSIAMEHLILAATNEGYGTCWIAAFDENKVRNLLKVPENYSIIAMTPIGVVGEDKAHYDKKDITEHVFLNNWNNIYI